MAERDPKTGRFPKGNGAGHGPTLHGSHGPSQPQFGHGRQPPPMHKSAGVEARAAYLAKVAERQDKALEVFDKAMELALVEKPDASMVNVGLRAAQHITETLHGRPAQAITGEDGGALEVVIRRLVDTEEDAGSPAPG